MGDGVVAQDKLGLPYTRKGIVVRTDKDDVYFREEGAAQPTRRNKRMVRPAPSHLQD